VSAESTLRLVVESLNELEIPYMLTGSLASAFYGTPRSTQDVDVVVDADDSKLQRLGELLRDAGLYVDSGAISEAVRTRGLFNAVDASTGWKADFILMKNRPFSRTEFAARVPRHLAGIPLTIVRAEDIIVAKLEWAKLAESERQLRDVVGILMVQGGALDRGRIERWVAELSLGPLWGRALDLEQKEREPG
jgi:hypothetical protein